MSFSNVLQLFVPKDRVFFPLFQKATQNLVVISNTLVQMVNAVDPNQRRVLIKEIERLEHVGDNVTHEMFNELSANFITPFDREDMHELITSLDDIVDFIHGSAKRIDLYKIEVISPAMIKLAELIQTSANELHIAISEMANKKNVHKIKEACVRINSIENHADDVFDTAIAGLFENEKDAIVIIKIKEVLAALETATDKCEDAANVLQTIIVKNA
jgi:predicted phosphate transport protein (TIGR00153 family)